MLHFRFYKLTEIKAAKKEKREPVAIWGLTCDTIGMLKEVVKKNDLFEDWIWMEV